MTEAIKIFDPPQTWIACNGAWLRLDEGRDPVLVRTSGATESMR